VPVGPGHNREMASTERRGEGSRHREVVRHIQWVVGLGAGHDHAAAGRMEVVQAERGIREVGETARHTEHPAAMERRSGLAGVEDSGLVGVGGSGLVEGDIDPEEEGHRKAVAGKEAVGNPGEGPGLLEGGLAVRTAGRILRTEVLLTWVSRRIQGWRYVIMQSLTHGSGDIGKT
jgi:hypothetical protein